MFNSLIISLHVFLVLCVTETVQYSHFPINIRRLSSKLRSSLLEKMMDSLKPARIKEDLSEEDLMIAKLDPKPWRAPKIKNLKIVYRPWKDSWMERYRMEEDDTIYLYSVPEYKSAWDRTKVEEIWSWPWLWTKVKAERLAYCHKRFMADVESVTVQEHMEIDAFFSEFDMPARWGLLRMKEFDVLNVIAFQLTFFFDFNGIEPTDLGLRPDGSVRTCPVQFHNCISSSNAPTDSDHYAPPFKWSRSKSPDQAYEEVKNVYFNYPKRGLKWSSGWIDRGGWKPVQFSGPYFYAQAESLVWHYTDDIELVLDVEKREVQYRSQMRLGQTDWDVQRLRYNQFTRMLTAKGGWEVEPLPRLAWVSSTPYRWTNLVLDKTVDATEAAADAVVSAVQNMGRQNSVAGESVTDGAAAQAVEDFFQWLQPYLQPVVEKATELGDGIAQNERVIALQHAWTQLFEAEQRLLTASQQTVDPVMQQIETRIRSLGGFLIDEDEAAQDQSLGTQRSSVVGSIQNAIRGLRSRLEALLDSVNTLQQQQQQERETLLAPPQGDVSGGVGESVAVMSAGTGTDRGAALKDTPGDNGRGLGDNGRGPGDNGQGPGDIRFAPGDWERLQQRLRDTETAAPSTLDTAKVMEAQGTSNGAEASSFIPSAAEQQRSPEITATLSASSSSKRLSFAEFLASKNRASSTGPWASHTHKKAVSPRYQQSLDVDGLLEEVVEAKTKGLASTYKYRGALRRTAAMDAPPINLIS